MIIKLNRGMGKSSNKYKILCEVSIKEIGFGKNYLEKERMNTGELLRRTALKKKKKERKGKERIMKYKLLLVEWETFLLKERQLEIEESRENH